MKEESKYTAKAVNGPNPTVFDYLKAKGSFNFPTDDVQVYAQAVANMNLGDLQAHAIDKGVRPSSDRRRLELALVNNFKQIIARKKANANSLKRSKEQIEKEEELRQKSLERSGHLRVIH